MSNEPHRPGGEENGGYIAFVSYSRDDNRKRRKEDGKSEPGRICWGDWIHQSLERFWIPKSLRGQLNSRNEVIPAKLSPSFRDEEELPAIPNISHGISDALCGSRYLVVICSPRSALSQWVNMEVLRFKAQGPEHCQRIFPIIVAGEPGASVKEGLSSDLECLCPALLYAVDDNGELDFSQPTEPLCADLRWGDDLSEINRKTWAATRDTRLQGITKLVAGILGVGFDDLWQRETRRRRRIFASFVAAISVVAAVICGLGTLAFVQWQKAEENLAEARHNFGRYYLGLAERRKSPPTLPDVQMLAAEALSFDVGYGPDPETLEAEGTTYSDWRQSTPTLLNQSKDPGLYEKALSVVGLSELRKGVSLPRLVGSLITSEDPANAVTCVAWSPDGTKLAWGTVDGGVEVRGLRSDGSNFSAQLEEKVNALEWDPNGHFLAACIQGDRIALWSQSLDGCQYLELEETPDDRFRFEEFFDLAWSPDGSILAATTTAGRIQFWERAGHQFRSTEPLEVADETEIVECIGFRLDGKQLAVGTGSGVVVFASLRNHGYVTDRQVSIGLNAINDLAWSPEGDAIIVASDNGGVFLRSVDSADEAIRFESSSAVGAVGWSNDGNWVLAGLKNEGEILVWEYGLEGFTESPSYVLRSQSGAVDSLSFCAVGELVATASHDGSIRVWELPIDHVPYKMPSEGRVTSVEWSPNNQWIAAAVIMPDEGDSFVSIREVRSGVEVKRIFESGPIDQMAWSAKGALALLGRPPSRQVSVWRQGKSLNLDVKNSFRIDWNLTGERLAIGTEDGKIFAWKDLAAGGDSSEETSVEQFMQMEGSIWAMAWSPTDQECLAATDYKSNLEVFWGGEKLAIHKLNAGSVIKRLAWNSDGQQLIGLVKGSVGRWDVSKSEGLSYDNSLEKPHVRDDRGRDAEDGPDKAEIEAFDCEWSTGRVGVALLDGTVAVLDLNQIFEGATPRQWSDAASFLIEGAVEANRNSLKWDATGDLLAGALGNRGVGVWRLNSADESDKPDLSAYLRRKWVVLDPVSEKYEWNPSPSSSHSFEFVNVREHSPLKSLLNRDLPERDLNVELFQSSLEKRDWASAWTIYEKLNAQDKAANAGPLFDDFYLLAVYPPANYPETWFQSKLMTLAMDFPEVTQRLEKFEELKLLCFRERVQELQADNPLNALVR